MLPIRSFKWVRAVTRLSSCWVCMQLVGGNWMARKLFFQLLPFYFHWKKLGVVLNVAGGDLCYPPPPPPALINSLECTKKRTSNEWFDGYAMLISPIKGETTVHGCHCPGDMAVCMHKVLARPRFGVSESLVFSINIIILTKWRSSFRSLHTE